jgi:hypothetical protein
VAFMVECCVNAGRLKSQVLCFNLPKLVRSLFYTLTKGDSKHPLWTSLSAWPLALHLMPRLLGTKLPVPLKEKSGAQPYSLNPPSSCDFDLKY